MSRQIILPAALLVGLSAVVVAPSPQVQAQPPAAAPVEGAPSPLDLVQGLREQGMSDLALEYLKELESNPNLSADQKLVLPLEKAKCQLEAADIEPDDAARASLIAEATVGFSEFLKRSSTHPRAAEAAIALARLKSLEAKSVLIKARRIEVPTEDGPAKDEAITAQKTEAAKARPLFQKASELFKQGSDRLEAQIKNPALDVPTRRALEQERLDAELARGINFFALADTYLHATAGELKTRSDNLDKAKDLFSALAKQPGSGRAGWVARAWMAECEMERDNPKVAEAEFEAILKSNLLEADEGKRTVRFFQLRRNYLNAFAEGDLKKVYEAEQMCRTWLNYYGANRRARHEATAVRYYLAYILQRQAYVLTPLPKDYPKTAYKPGNQAEQKLKEAERHYRVLTQSDSEYTDRAIRNRMIVVRQLVGEAQQPPSAYTTFEDAQMAAVIQIAQLSDIEKDDTKAEELKARRMKVVALLERARSLATSQDSTTDVLNVMLQLIYFYELTGQPQQAAILGEYIARFVKTSGGKSSLAGAMALGGYGLASSQVPASVDVQKYRQADRIRAIQLARFIDEKYPNDTYTDRARFRLGAMLFEERDFVGAYEAFAKIRPGYEGIITARLYQGAVATQLLTDPKAGLPDNRKIAVFRQTVEDLEKLTAPNSTATSDEVRAYFSARVRLGMLMLLQSRIDPAGEKSNPGYKKAQDLADELLAQINNFPALQTDKKLNLDGWESKLLAEDSRARAAFLRSRLILDQAADPAGYEAVFTVIGPLLAEMDSQGPFVDQVKGIAAMGAEDDGDGAQKARIAAIAAGADKIRREIIVVALKTRVRQGDADNGVKLIDLLKKFGGSIEANVPVLEQLSREIGGQIQKYRMEGKVEEAKALADGFAKLLARVSDEPNLSPTVQLFIGQSLIAVENFTGAIEVLRKIPPPADEKWLMLPAKEFQALEDKDRQDTIRYRGATLYLVRALRLSGQFDEAANILTATIGTKEARGWGYSSLDFRKETAYLYEARGAAAPPGDPAGKENYGKALQEWTVIYSIFKGSVERDIKEPPMNGGNVDNQAILRNKNSLYDAFFDIQRCLVQANLKLLAANPASLDKSLEKVAKSCIDVEKLMGDDLDAAVWNKYCDLLEISPRLKQLYEQAGGKKFLTRPETQ